MLCYTQSGGPYIIYHDTSYLTAACGVQFPFFSQDETLPLPCPSLPPDATRPLRGIEAVELDLV